MAKIVTSNTVMDRVMELHRLGNVPGERIGFDNLDQHYTVKLGTSTIIYGHPTAGKSEFLKEITKPLTCRKGWKGMMYSPETGDAAEIYAELASALTWKTFDKRFDNYISEKELMNVMAFIQSNYIVIDNTDEKGLMLDEWVELTKQGIKDFGIKWSSIDNWNDVDHDLMGAGGMISEYLKKALPKVNRLAKTQNIHAFIVCHARNPVVQNGDKFPSPPRPDEIEGGSLWYAKAMNLIGLHREYIETPNGWEQSNELTVDIRKVKPKIVGKKGRVKLQYNVKKSSYFNDTGMGYQYLQTPFNSYEPTQTEQFNQAPF
jgi:hypothetical protein